VDRFRRHTAWLILVSSIVAVVLVITSAVRADPSGTFIIEWVLAALLLASRIWWRRQGHQRIADLSGTVAMTALTAMSCGTIAMVELRLHFPLADGMLRSLDQALGVDGIAIAGALARQGRWIFVILAPAYNFTNAIFFAGLVFLALCGDRVEAWRAAFCFAGALLTTCLIAILVPAKGLGVWAPPSLFAQLPDEAMRSFWPHFDDFYFGADPVLRLQVIDGVISFPSFHSIAGFLSVMMWRKNIVTLFAASSWLVIMLVATIPGGGHYVVDLLGGFMVWAFWFVLSRRIERATLARQSVKNSVDEGGG
jgi:hypothetical protein